MAQTPNGQPMNDATINLTADDLNPGGVNNAPSPNRIPPGDIDISQDVEQGPTAPTPGKKDTSQAIGNPKKINLPPPIVSPTPTVPMFAPDGTPGDIPSEKVHEAIANGGSIGVPVLAPDGTHGIVPAGRLHDALKAGGKIDSSGWTPDQLNAHPTIGQRLEKTITGPGMVIDPDALKNSRNVELSKMSPIAATQEIHQAASIPLVRPEQAMTPEEQQNNPTLHAGLEFAGGLSSLENLAIMVGSGGLGRLPGPAGPLIAKALSAGFSLQVIAQTAQESPKFMEALARGDENEAKYELTKMVLGLGMAEQGAEHVGTNEATGEKAFNPNLGTAVGTSADALVHAAGEYGGKAIDAAKNIPGAGLVKGAAGLVKGIVKQPINAMTEGPEAKITRAAGGSAGVQERDFQENIPRAMKYIVEENKTNPIKTPEDMAEAAYNQKNKLGQQLYKSRPGETIDGNRVADQITSGINKSTAQHFPEVADAITKWADTFRGPYNLDDAMAAITDFNSKLRQFYKQSPSDQFRMAQADPKLGMLQDAADALRDVAFKKLEDLGEKNIPELRKDYGALNQLQRIFEKRAVVYGRQAPIDFKSSLGAIAAVASGHPLAAAVPYLTKYLNSPEYLLQSGIEKASKAAEAGKPSNPQIEQSRTPVKEIRPPGVKPYQEPVTPGGQAALAATSPTGTAVTPTEAGKPVKTAPVKAPVNPTAATEAPAPDSGIDLETGAAPTEGVRSDFKPYTPENQEGYEPRLNAPADRRPKGFAPGDEHDHEWAHITNAALEGWGTGGIKSHFNTDLPSKRTTAAATVIPKGIDWKDPDSVARNLGKILSVVLGGGVGNELNSKIPFEINQGISSDVALIKNTLRKSLGFTDDEIDAAIRYGRDRAKRNLTQPGINDIMLANSRVRESGLDQGMHVSPERTEAYAEEVRRIQDANRQASQQQAGTGEGVDENRVNPEVRGLNQPADTEREEGDEEPRPAGDLETGRGLKETTTGDDKADRAIRQAGAIPAGKMMNLALFHDPETGSTLALDQREVTPELVQKHLEESREKFGVKAGASLETGKEDTASSEPVPERPVKAKTEKTSSAVLKKAEQAGYAVVKSSDDVATPKIGLISPHGRSIIDVNGSHDGFLDAVGMSPDEQFDNGWVRKTGPAAFQFGKLKSPYAPVVNEVERQILTDASSNPVQLSGEDFQLDTTRQDVAEHGLASLIAKAKRLEKISK